MFSGAWPEGTRLRIKATRDPADVDLNGQAWHTEGRTYELEVRAEDEMDRSTGVANHVRLVDCDEVHMGAPTGRAGHAHASSSSARQGAASMQGVFKPERLRMLNERHWQQVLRDANGHNYKERVAYLRGHERRLSRSMRAELFVPNDITSASHGWYAATHCTPNPSPHARPHPSPSPSPGPSLSPSPNPTTSATPSRSPNPNTWPGQLALSRLRVCGAR